MSQYDDDDDDLFDTADEDEEEAESDLSADSSPASKVVQISPARVAHGLRQAAQQPKRRLRVRPMPPRMMAKNPQVVSMLLTRDDGRQIMFVRK